MSLGGKPSTSSTNVSRVIARRLDAVADPKTKEWWETYMKGSISFRGVPMAAIRRIVHDVWSERNLNELPLPNRIEIALAQFEARHSEDKVAGVLMLAELLVDELETPHVTLLARPFEQGHIWDWSTCDWYCVKSLGSYVARGDRKERAERIADWRDKEDLWQRRAAAVAFVNHAPEGDRFFKGFSSLIIKVCRRNVRDPARFSQTSVGWVLRELSKGEPRKVSAFIDRHGKDMSREAFRAATRHL